MILGKVGPTARKWLVVVARSTYGAGQCRREQERRSVDGADLPLHLASAQEQCWL
jgi:hypothetical protein